MLMTRASEYNHLPTSHFDWILTPLVDYVEAGGVVTLIHEKQDKVLQILKISDNSGEGRALQVHVPWREWGRDQDALTAAWKQLGLETFLDELEGKPFGIGTLIEGQAAEARSAAVAVARAAFGIWGDADAHLYTMSCAGAADPLCAPKTEEEAAIRAKHPSLQTLRRRRTGILGRAMRIARELTVIEWALLLVLILSMALANR